MTPGWWAAALFVLAPPAPESPALAAWHGDWVGEGQAFGKPATATLDIGAGEEGATRLSYRLAIAGAPPVRYSAEAMYRIDAKRRVTGTWTDSYGASRPVAGVVDAGKWAVHWGAADSEIGRSTYTLEAADRLVVNDSVLQDDGSWRLFASLAYRRKSP